MSEYERNKVYNEMARENALQMLDIEIAETRAEMDKPLPPADIERLNLKAVFLCMIQDRIVAEKKSNMEKRTPFINPQETGK